MHDKAILLVWTHSCTGPLKWVSSVFRKYTRGVSFDKRIRGTTSVSPFFNKRSIGFKHERVNNGTPKTVSQVHFHLHPTHDCFWNSMKCENKCSFIFTADWRAEPRRFPQPARLLAQFLYPFRLPVWSGVHIARFYGLLCCQYHLHRQAPRNLWRNVIQTRNLRVRMWKLFGRRGMKGVLRTRRPHYSSWRRAVSWVLRVHFSLQTFVCGGCVLLWAIYRNKHADNCFHAQRIWIDRLIWNEPRLHDCHNLNKRFNCDSFVCFCSRCCEFVCNALGRGRRENLWSVWPNNQETQALTNEFFGGQKLVENLPVFLEHRSIAEDSEKIGKTHLEWSLAVVWVQVKIPMWGQPLLCGSKRNDELLICS